MKKILLLAAMIVSTLSVSAQNEVGQVSIKPTAGVNFACLTNHSEFNTKIKAGFVGGIEAEYGISERFGLSAGLLFSMQGCKWDKWPAEYESPSGVDLNGINIDVNLNYLNIPILAKYYIVGGLAIQAGVQPGIRLSAKESVQYNGVYDGAKYKERDNVDVKEWVNGFDLSLPVGLSFEYANVVLDARYNIGLTNVIATRKIAGLSGKDSSKNSVFMLTLGYKFKI